MKAVLLIVDDEQVQREMLRGYLEKKGYEVFTAASGQNALDVVAVNTVDVLITDQKMPGMDGLELSMKVAADHPNVSVVIMTAYGSIENAVQAMRHGVEDYLTKPVDLDELEVILDRVLEKRNLVRENEWLREQVRKAPAFSGVVYVSSAMKEVMSRVARAAESHATVLITGESGTGKEVVARAIHEASNRSDRQFIAVNCAAVPENLIESELFGHEKGAFTGADRQRFGRFEQADGGTLFLDEIAEIPPQTQVKMLRVLQERRFERVGGNESITVDTRIIAATNRNLEQEVQAGGFRQDLFYRLNVVSIHVPPLRDRRSDIPALIEHFVKKYADEYGKPVTGVTPETMDILVKYPFPGNVRELGNIIEQAVVLTRSDVLGERDLPDHVVSHADTSEDSAHGLEEQVAVLERDALRNALDETGGNKSAAARLLGISERKIRYMINKYGESV